MNEIVVDAEVEQVLPPSNNGSKMLTDFRNSICIDSEHMKTVAKTPDAIKNSIMECQEMGRRALAARRWSIAAYALSAYKIEKEGLWKGQFENKLDCVMALLDLEKSAAYNYLNAGPIVYMAMEIFGAGAIPKTLPPLLEFYKVKDTDKMLMAYQSAWNEASKSPRGEITVEFAKKAVEPFVIPKSRKSTTTKALEVVVRSNECGSERDPDCMTVSEVEPEQTSEKIKALIEQYANDCEVKRKDINKVARGLEVMLDKYLEKDHRDEYLEQLQKLFAGLHNTVKKHRKIVIMAPVADQAE